MAKVKEYPIIIAVFLKDLLKGNFKSCSKKIQDLALYFLDKCLERNSSIRYFIWKLKKGIKYYEINNSEIKFAILYFYNDRFKKTTYNKFKKSIENQYYKNYVIYIADNDNVINQIEKNDCSYICFVEQDDKIANHALNNLVKIIQNDPSTELIYSDEDVINRFGIRTKPYFKPQYAPLLLLSHNYMNAFLCLKVNKELIKDLTKIKKIDQDSIYSQILRMTRKKVICSRIPDVLYHRHWKNANRLENTSTRDIIQNEIIERKLNAKILDYNIKGLSQLKFYNTGNPKVSIIIPFKDKVSLLKECIKSIEENTTYNNYDIFLVNNGSKKKETLDYLDKTNYKIINANIDFNFSKLNNMAALIAEGEYLVLLNNDTKIITPDWIESMLGLAQLPEIGAVGIKLLYKNNKTQHAGVVIGVRLVNRFLDPNDGGYRNYNNLIREYICVSGACLMISKRKYNEVGGLNEFLAVEYNDFDFGLKLLEAGYYNVYNPHSVIYHYESITLKRNFKVSRKKENRYMHKSWIKFTENDPFYNPNFSRKRSDFAININ